MTRKQLFLVLFLLVGPSLIYPLSLKAASGFGFKQAEPTIPGQGDLSCETDGADEEDPSVKEQVRAIADYLAEDAEKPIKDAFVRSDELDNLTVPVEFTHAVDHYIAFFTIRKRKMFASWLRRARRYEPLLRRILREHDLPEDLVYLAMIESGFNPRAYSRAKACGPWQFIRATGQRYGLRIDHWVDERQDFEKATVAAARYLKDLFERFGCWYLAASGYNAGEGRVGRAMRKHRTSDYWKLYRYNTLPKETKEYIPQLIAAADIAENPGKYGFVDTDDSSLPYCTRLVPGGTPLYLVAKASLSDLSEIRSLNPALLTRITPPGKRDYQVKLPPDTPLELFDQALKSGLRGRRVVATVRLAAVRQRTLARILKRYGVSREDLKLVNRGSVRTGRGKTLYIPLFERTEVPAAQHRNAKLTSCIRTGAKKDSTSRTFKNGRSSTRTVLKSRKRSAGSPVKRTKNRGENRRSSSRYKQQ